MIPSRCRAVTVSRDHPVTWRCGDVAMWRCGDVVKWQFGEGDSVFSRVVFDSSEIINSAVQYLTPYEQAKPNRKVLRMLDNVFGEIELKILKEWPSKQALLNNQGIV